MKTTRLVIVLPVMLALLSGCELYQQRKDRLRMEEKQRRESKELQDQIKRREKSYKEYRKPRPFGETLDHMNYGEIRFNVETGKQCMNHDPGLDWGVSYHVPKDYEVGPMPAIDRGDRATNALLTEEFMNKCIGIERPSDAQYGYNTKHTRIKVNGRWTTSHVGWDDAISHNVNSRYEPFDTNPGRDRFVRACNYYNEVKDTFEAKYRSMTLTSRYKHRERIHDKRIIEYRKKLAKDPAGMELRKKKIIATLRRLGIHFGDNIFEIRDNTPDELTVNTEVWGAEDPRYFRPDLAQQQWEFLYFDGNDNLMQIWLVTGYTLEKPWRIGLLAAMFGEQRFIDYTYLIVLHVPNYKRWYEMRNKGADWPRPYTRLAFDSAIEYEDLPRLPKYVGDFRKWEI